MEWFPASGADACARLDPAGSTPRGRRAIRFLPRRRKQGRVGRAVRPLAAPTRERIVVQGPLRIHSSLSIPRRELRFRTSRSGGPGGQHVNTTDTRVELIFDVARSGSLGPNQRKRLLETLARRLDQKGRLHLFSSRFRSQSANREDVIRRFQRLLQEALRKTRPRKATVPTEASRRRRREEKKKHSRKKQQRRRVDSFEGAAR